MTPTTDDKGREHDARPWGEYLVLDDDAVDHKVKRITVAPHGRLSYQSHAKRAEHWFVVSGMAHVTLDDQIVEVAPGHAIDVPLGTKHRVENRGHEPLVFIEVQYGTYFGEDDIVRYQDDYGRSDD